MTCYSTFQQPALIGTLQPSFETTTNLIWFHWLPQLCNSANQIHLTGARLLSTRQLWELGTHWIRTLQFSTTYQMATRATYWYYNSSINHGHFLRLPFLQYEVEPFTITSYSIFAHHRPIEGGDKPVLFVTNDAGTVSKLLYHCGAKIFCKECSSIKKHLFFFYLWPQMGYVP